MHHGDPLDELSRLSILLGGVGGHPAEGKKRPSALNFIYEHPRTAPLGSDGALRCVHRERMPTKTPGVLANGEGKDLHQAGVLSAFDFFER